MTIHYLEVVFSTIRKRSFLLPSFLLMVLTITLLPAYSIERKIIISVSNMAGARIPNLRVLIDGAGDAKRTGPDGTVVVSLVNAELGDEFDIDIVDDKGILRLIDPLDRKLSVKKSQYYRLRAGSDKERSFVENPVVFQQLLRQLSQVSNNKTKTATSIVEQKKLALNQIASDLKLSVTELLQRIDKLADSVPKTKSASPLEVAASEQYKGNSKSAQEILLRARVNQKTPDLESTILLGRTFEDTGNYTEAERYYLEAKELEPKDSRVLSSLARLYSEKFQLGEAKSYCDEAIRILERNKKTESSAYYLMLNLHATILGRLGLLEEAQLELEKDLKLTAKLFGVESAQFATITGNLGFNLMRQRKFFEAETLMKKALAIDRKLFAPDSEEVGWNYHQLAVLYFDWGKDENGITFELMALKILEEHYELSHPDLRYLFNNLGYYYFHNGKMPEALVYLERLRKIGDGNDLLSSAQLGTIAKAYASADKIADAQRYFDKSITKAESEIQIRIDLKSSCVTPAASLNEGATNSFFHERPHAISKISDLLDSYAKFRKKQRDFSASEAILRSILDLHIKAHGINSEETHDCIVDLAELLEEQGDRCRAADLYQRASLIELALLKWPDIGLDNELVTVLDTRVVDPNSVAGFLGQDHDELAILASDLVGYGRNSVDRQSSKKIVLFNTKLNTLINYLYVEQDIDRVPFLLSFATAYKFAEDLTSEQKLLLSAIEICCINLKIELINAKNIVPLKPDAKKFYEFPEQALRTDVEESDIRTLLDCLSALSDYNLRLNKHKEALKALRLSYFFAKNLDSERKSQTLNSLISVAKKFGDEQLAVQYEALREPRKNNSGKQD